MAKPKGRISIPKPPPGPAKVIYKRLEGSRQVQIPVPWGQIRAIHWGQMDVRPILLLHGRDDNAGSFDILIPKLPKHLGYLAIDLPGHGHSSDLPPGMSYSTFEMMSTIYRIIEFFNWDYVSIIAHSLSAIVCYSLLPLIHKKVDLYIALDGLKPHIFTPVTQIEQIKRNLLNFHAEIVRKPKTYTYSEIVERYQRGTTTTINEIHAGRIVMRGMIPDPEDNTKFMFRRDPRMKYFNSIHISQSDAMEMAKKFTFPMCFIRASKPLERIIDQQKYWDEFCVAMEKQNDHFEVHTVEGDHFVHMTEADTVAQILTPFLEKYRPEEVAKQEMGKL